MGKFADYMKNAGWFGAGVLGTYLASNKFNKRKFSLGFVGSITALYLAVGVLPSQINGCNERSARDAERKYGVEIMKMREDSIKQVREHEKNMKEYELIEQGKLKPKSSLSDSLVPQIQKYQNENKVLLDKVSILESKINSKLGKVDLLEEKITRTENQTALYQKELQKSLNAPSSINETYNAKKSNDINDTNNSSGIEHIIKINKTTNTLSLFGKTGNLLYTCQISLAKNGGPPSGEYAIVANAPRSGELWPGVLKLNQSPIVITGAGDKNQYAPDIKAKRNENKSGGRVLNDAYNYLSGEIGNTETRVIIQ